METATAKHDDRSRAKGFVVCAVAHVAALAAAVATLALIRVESPFTKACAADVVATCVVFAFSRAYDNSSVYDPYWSVLPPFILAYYVTCSGPVPANGFRVLGAFAVVSFWGVRLTYSWARRFKGILDEDFRYVDLRRQHGARYWAVSFAGVHLFPTLLVFLGCSPLYYAATSPAPFDVLDVVGLAVAAAGTAVEARADSELHAFRRSHPAKTAILESGLWRLSCHPNYFGEMTFWWGLFALGLAGSSGAAWTIVGVVAITGLFRFVSIPLMDARMALRRPDYAEHRRRTSAVIPWWPKP